MEPSIQGKRMEDWLNNMSDWNISRKRFYGLPFLFIIVVVANLMLLAVKKN